MRRLINDQQINNIINSKSSRKGLELLNTRQSVGSLSETDQLDHNEMERIWMYSRQVQSTITGKEPFPGEMLKPKYENILLSEDNLLNLMVDYYNEIYEGIKFRKPFTENIPNSIIIPLKINKYCRCRIGSEIFGSTLSPRHQKSSYILSKFETEDGKIEIFPGQIQFFFIHQVCINGIDLSDHNFAYIWWYKLTKNRYHFAINDDNEEEQICNTELWKTEFYPKNRDCIIPVHHILGRFVPVKYKITDRINAKEYIAVNPINRKYYLH